MKSKVELLEEIDELIRELTPKIEHEDELGIYLHRAIQIHVSEETLQHLINDLKRATGQQ